MSISRPPFPCRRIYESDDKTNKMIKNIVDKYNARFDKIITSYGLTAIGLLVAIMIFASLVTVEYRELFNWFVVCCSVFLVIIIARISILTCNDAKKIVNVAALRTNYSKYSELFGETEAREIIKIKYGNSCTA